MPPDVAARFYGFFLDRYPLYAFALVYGLARLLTAMLAPGPSGVPRRLVGGLIGLALLLAASLHPTFGGMVLRTGFDVGAIAFMNATPMPLAYALGTAGAALAFGLPVGLGVVLTGHRGHAPGARWLRWRGGGRCAGSPVSSPCGSVPRSSASPATPASAPGRAGPSGRRPRGRGSPPRPRRAAAHAARRDALSRYCARPG